MNHQYHKPMTTDQPSSIQYPASSIQPDVRQVALEILNRLEQYNQKLDAIMHTAFVGAEIWSRRDRALLNALVYGVLRWRGRLDYIINHYSKTRLSKIDLNVLNILRLGLFQILHLNRVPNSAAVNSSVELAKSSAAPWVIGYVNAILRNAARGHRHVPFPDHEKNPTLALAAKKSFPEWLIGRWLENFDRDGTAALCDAINTIPAITLRTNTLLTTREKLINALKSEVQKINRTDCAPDGVYLQNPQKPISQLTAFKDGWFQVQDEAAQLVTLFLDPQPGESVLDACAGLGGKTGHIAQVMQNRGTIVALDKNEEKLIELQSQMQRLGISIVTTDLYDLNTTPDNSKLERFDRILLDAPCSGLGVLRRNPDIKWTMLQKNLQRHKEKQLKFLDNLSILVKPTGVLVYAVCSNEREENEEVVKDFLSFHPEFILDNRPKEFYKKADTLITQQGYLKTFPYPHSMDGFFAACLRRS
jgi:16S rRNA (cytosine967-C5)-methyltransferase